MCECHALHYAALDAEAARIEPSCLYRPRLFIDGNEWCALYGENLQDGVAGFGRSPAEACDAFDRAWRQKLPCEGEAPQ